MDASASGGLSDRAQGERLESWKEIAAYLKRGITTVQRWEQQEGLPVHRLPHAKKGSVFALKSELDAWRDTRSQLGPLRTELAEPNGTDHAGNAVDRRSYRPNSGSLIALVILFVVGIAALAMARIPLGARSASIASAERRLVPRPLANDVAMEWCSSLSPDGSHIVYHWRRADDPGLYIKSISGGEPRKLVTAYAGSLAECAYAKWSPTGELIAFLARANAGWRNLWVVAPSGGQARQLTSVGGIGLCWSPDGKSIAFADRNSTGEPFSIFSVRLRDGERRRLTNPPLSVFGDTYCAFSPTGRRLAIVRHASVSQSDLYITGLEGHATDDLERLTTGLSGLNGIDWSPDAQTIVFGSHHGLWEVSVEAPRQRAVRIAALEGPASDPTFSRAAARGSTHRLAYTAMIWDVNNWEWDREQKRVATLAPSTWWENFPAVTSGGRRVAFASNRTGDNEIWTVNADGSELRQLTFHRGPVVTSPRWSPDEKYIAFSSQVGANRDIYVSRSDGSQSNRVTTAPSEEENPSWSRDGRWLYFRSDQQGISQIWRVSALGGAPARVTTGEASQGFESPDGSLLYFVRSIDVPGLWSVPVQGGKETPVLPDVREGYWAVADRGIYFLTLAPTGSPKATALKFIDFATTTVSTIADAPMAGKSLSPGLSVSRDGRFIVWTQIDNAKRDLMLIDPWKP